MTLLEAVDAGPKALKDYRRWLRSPRVARSELQKLQRAGVIYWVPSRAGKNMRVRGHWARCSLAPVEKL